MFIRRSDMHQIWEERGFNQETVNTISQAMMLDSDVAAAYMGHHDIPFPFYVDMGREFVLAPSMSALLNPFAGVARHLKSCYRSDWDRAVDSREKAFRIDIASLFKPPRYSVLPSGVSLRRKDGTLLTDVDAVVLDRKTGTLALVQLKWHDVFAHSLRERESRKRNLLAANQWVERVSTWIGERSSADVAATLGIPSKEGQNNAKPVILIVARYAARFSGIGEYDPRGAWLPWPELVRAATLADENSDVLRIIATAFKGTTRHRWSEGNAPATTTSHFRFPELDVEVITSEADQG